MERLTAPIPADAMILSGVGIRGPEQPRPVLCAQAQQPGDRLDSIGRVLFGVGVWTPISILTH